MGSFATPPKLDEKVLLEMKESRWHFDGAGDFADLGTVDIADVVTFVMYLRFTSDPNQDNDSQLFELKDSNGNLINVYKNGDSNGAAVNGRLTLNVLRPGQPTVWVNSDPVRIEIDSWHFVAITLTPTEQRVQLDGATVSNGALTLPAAASQLQLAGTIAARVDGKRTLPVSVAAFQIYNGGLTYEQVALLLLKGKFALQDRLSYNYNFAVPNDDGVLVETVAGKNAVLKGNPTHEVDHSLEKLQDIKGFASFGGSERRYNALQAPETVLPGGPMTFEMVFRHSTGDALSAYNNDYILDMVNRGSITDNRCVANPKRGAASCSGFATPTECCKDCRFETYAGRASANPSLQDCVWVHPWVDDVRVTVRQMKDYALDGDSLYTQIYVYDNAARWADHGIDVQSSTITGAITFYMNYADDEEVFGGWHHLVIRCSDDGLWTVWMDGFVTSGATQVSPDKTGRILRRPGGNKGPLLSETTMQVAVGGEAFDSAAQSWGTYRGDIAMVRIFEGALTTSEISNLFSSATFSTSKPLSLDYNFNNMPGFAQPVRYNLNAVKANTRRFWNFGDRQDALQFSGASLPVVGTVQMVFQLRSKVVVETGVQVLYQFKSADGSTEITAKVTPPAAGSRLVVSWWIEGVGLKNMNTDATVVLDQWHMLLVTYANDGFRVQLDGVTVHNGGFDTARFRAKYATLDGGILASATGNNKVHAYLASFRVFPRIFSYDDAAKFFENPTYMRNAALYDFTFVTPPLTAGTVTDRSAQLALTIVGQPTFEYATPPPFLGAIENYATFGRNDGSAITLADKVQVDGTAGVTADLLFRLAHTDEVDGLYSKEQVILELRDDNGTPSDVCAPADGATGASCSAKLTQTSCCRDCSGAKGVISADPNARDCYWKYAWVDDTRLTVSVLQHSADSVTVITTWNDNGVRTQGVILDPFDIPTQQGDWIHMVVRVSGDGAVMLWVNGRVESGRFVRSEGRAYLVGPGEMKRNPVTTATYAVAVGNKNIKNAAFFGDVARVALVNRAVPDADVYQAYDTTRLPSYADALFDVDFTTQDAFGITPADTPGLARFEASSYRFDGKDEYGILNGIKLAASFTVEVVLKPSTDISDQQRYPVFSATPTGADFQLECVLKHATQTDTMTLELKFFPNDPDEKVVAFASGYVTVKTNSWNHLLVTVDLEQKEARLQLNGETGLHGMYGSSRSSTRSTTFDSFHILRTKDGTQHAPVSMGLVRMYSPGLTYAQAATLFTEGPAVDTKGAVHSFEFQSPAASSLADTVAGGDATLEFRGFPTYETQPDRSYLRQIDASAVLEFTDEINPAGLLLEESVTLDSTVAGTTVEVVFRHRGDGKVSDNEASIFEMRDDNGTPNPWCEDNPDFVGDGGRDCGSLATKSECCEDCGVMISSGWFIANLTNAKNSQDCRYREAWSDDAVFALRQFTPKSKLTRTVLAYTDNNDLAVPPVTVVTEVVDDASGDALGKWQHAIISVTKEGVWTLWLDGVVVSGAYGTRDGKTVLLRPGPIAREPVPAVTFNQVALGSDTLGGRPYRGSVALFRAYKQAVTTIGAYEMLTKGHLEDDVPTVLNYVPCNPASEAACFPFRSRSGSCDASGTCTACLTTEYKTGGLCRPLTNCGPGEYASKRSTETSDRECAPLATCQVTEYESTAAGPFNNRVCTPCQPCPKGQIVTVDCDGSAQPRICEQDPASAAAGGNPAATEGPTRAPSSSKTAAIAGGVGGFVAVLILIAIVVVLKRKPKVVGASSTSAKTRETVAFDNPLYAEEGSQSPQPNPAYDEPTMEMEEDAGYMDVAPHMQ